MGSTSNSYFTLVNVGSNLTMTDSYGKSSGDGNPATEAVRTGAANQSWHIQLLHY